MKTVPAIELLESRISPATFTVTSLVDAVPAPAGSLRAELAVADASPGPDKIVFRLPPPITPHGENMITLTGGGLTSKGNVTITGPGAGKLIINAAGASSVFIIDDNDDTADSPATISGLSMVGGLAATGAGVYSTESLTLHDVVISQCKAIRGGAITVADSSPRPPETVNITNSLITNNSVTDIAGAMDLIDLKSISIRKTTVTGNTSGGIIGGIFAGIGPSGSGIAITGCTIDGNRAAGYGGGLEVINDATSPKAKVIISGSVIAGNSSTVASPVGGGGLLLSGGKAVITGSTIRNNEAVEYGGGISAQYLASFTISHSTICGNRTLSAGSAAQGGGGVFIKGSGTAIPEPVSITGSSITDNISASEAGGLLATDGIALTLVSTTVSGNLATFSGGGIVSYGYGANLVDLNITSGTISNNVCGTEGGAVAAAGDGRISLSSTKVTGNLAAGQGGGMYLRSYAVTNSVILKFVTVSNNSAGNNSTGGGISIIAAPDFHITGGSFTDNYSAGGGAIAVSSSSGSIRGATVTGNDASSDGGGILQSGTGTVVVQAAKVSGNTSVLGPDFFGTFTFV